MSSSLINPNPEIYATQSISRNDSEQENNEEYIDEFDALEVYDLIRNINDPEHPLSLEQLKVTQHDLITVDNKNNLIVIYFTPTITHCSMATLIGLSIRVKLLRSLPKRFKVDIFITPGTHQSEDQVNKQLNDKERVAAALENERLLSVVNRCIAQS
ncbi:predicted protein [Naegleria gruberi]|uniref:Predicted protein n=1 Tax=Naegleria gruberi TaxID=5762 RepID=D2VP27_NAEGR|nr:uncharacterized protein NAEGRDRAFT_70708 [Naegleria gruberi]EFC41285.1 predicted protein [Naegleria gruberi]|eukprot:XP_002674029.1 predicted protein [Naegleria gruberi strain NEG-M]